MVNGPLIRPYFLGVNVALGGSGPLGSHDRDRKLSSVRQPFSTFTPFHCFSKFEKTVRIQVCPKKGITPTFLFFSDGIGTLHPILGRGLES